MKTHVLGLTAIESTLGSPAYTPTYNVADLLQCRLIYFHVHVSNAIVDSTAVSSTARTNRIACVTYYDAEMLVTHQNEYGQAHKNLMFCKGPTLNHLDAPYSQEMHLKA